MSNYTMKDLAKRANEDGQLLIDPEMANYILLNAVFPGQRKPKRYNTQRNVLKLERGEWQPYHQIDIVQEGTNFYLTNGQHRLLGVIKYNKGSVPISVRIYEAGCYDEVKEIYKTTDDLGGRGMSDIASAHGIEAFKSLLANEQRSAILSSKILTANFNYATALGAAFFRIRTKNELIEHAASYSEGILKYINIIRTGEPSKQLKSKLTSGMYIALGYLTQESEGHSDFWLTLAKDEGLLKGDPIKLLADTLKAMRGSKRSDDYRNAHNAFARCWNAWYTGKKLTTLNSIHKDELIGIKGTQFSTTESYE